MKADPVTLEVVRSSLIQAAEQMGATVQRTAYSTIIYEAVDFVCAILDKRGDLVAGTMGIPCFLGNLSMAIKDVDSTIGIQNIAPEDVIFCNDPYVGGGTHGNDITAIFPVYHRNSIIGFTAFKGHTVDMGGIHAGGWYNNTTEIFQELVRVPPVKLYRGGEPDEDLLRVIKANCRTPELLAGDIRAMVSALRTGANSVNRLAERFGRDAFQVYLEAILDHADRLTRQEIRKIPEGTYNAELFLDGDGDDGMPISRKLKIAMKVKVEGDHMTVDMSGSDPQSKGPMNSPRAASFSFIRYGFKSITTPHLPINDGSFRALDIILKKGTLLDPTPPAACSLWVEVGVGLPDLILKALAPAVPDRVRAASFGSDVPDFTYGTDPRSGRLYVLVETCAPGGWGAKPHEDGETLLAVAEGNGFFPMVEYFEILYPLLVRRFELIQDSGGPGKYRGGLGVVKECMIVNHDAHITADFERQVYSPPWGLFGGKNGRSNYLSIIRQDGRVEKHEKITHYPLNDGDIMVYETGGGGGYGDALERDEERVLHDVLDGYVSVEKAKEEYGVVLDIAKNRVDLEATRSLRKQKLSQGLALA